MKLHSTVLLLAWSAVACGAERPPAATLPLPRFAVEPLVEDYYPPVSRTLGEQGTATIRVCFDNRGKAIESTIVESSGYRRLDQAAVQMGKAYRAMSQIANGQPQSDCELIPVEFILAEPVKPANPGENQRGIPPNLPPVNPPPPPPPPVRPVPLPANPPPSSFR
jgi:TonB family protein